MSGLALALIVGLIVGIYWLLSLVISVLGPVLWPLAVAGVLASLVDPVVDFLDCKGIPRARAIICVFALALVLVLGLFGSVVPRLVIETRLLVNRVPTY